MLPPNPLFVPVPLSAHSLPEASRLSQDLRPARILHLADRAQDATHLRALLADAGAPFDLTCSAAADFLPMPAGDFDLIVCEFTLSASGQLAQLTALRKTNPSAPWLFVASTGDSPAEQESRFRFALSVRAVLVGLSRTAPDTHALAAPPASAPPPAPVAGLDHWHALRRFSEGVAHDFNNLLTVINGHSSIALMREDLPADVLQSMQQIYSAGERASALTRRLLVFGRPSVIAPKPRALNESLPAFIPALARSLGKNITLETDLAPGLPSVAADHDLLDNVIQNIALRLRSNMPQGGALSLRARMHELPARPPGRFVRLSIGAPSAAPLAGDAADALFEPYATEKTSCTESALCLATAFGTVANHYGWIEAETPPGSGPTFHVFLPACADAPSSTASVIAPSEASARERQAAAPRGGETILLVEDEAPVRDFARAALHQHGYRVLLAATAKDALETWQWHSSRISLLVTDLVLPDDFTGLELARRLRAQKPALHVLCTSGCTRDAVERQDPAFGPVRFLQKPYSIRALAQAVREALDAP